MKRRFPTPSELILLKHLQHAPMYGMELADKAIDVGPRGIYSLLGRLRQQRYVQICERISDCPGKPRPMYSITDDGQACVDLAEQLDL